MSLDRDSGLVGGAAALAAWGVVGSALGASGLPASSAVALQLAAVWGSRQLVLAPPGAPSSSWTWQRADMAADFVRCAVYATATQAAYRWLRGRLG